jgi:hypothetical protein
VASSSLLIAGISRLAWISCKPIFEEKMTDATVTEQGNLAQVAIRQ